MKKHEINRKLLKATGEAYIAGDIPSQPNLFTPEQVDDDLRETVPGCAEHYERINGLLSHAELYFAAETDLGYQLSRRHMIDGGDDVAIAECRHQSSRHYDALLLMLETMRNATTAAPVSIEQEHYHRDRDITLMRAIVTLLAERATETVSAMNAGMAVVDNVCALRAEMRAIDTMLELAMSTAGHHEEVSA